MHIQYITYLGLHCPSHHGMHVTVSRGHGIRKCEPSVFDNFDNFVIRCCTWRRPILALSKEHSVFLDIFFSVKELVGTFSNFSLSFHIDVKIVRPSQCPCRVYISLSRVSVVCVAVASWPVAWYHVRPRGSTSPGLRQYQ